MDWTRFLRNGFSSFFFSRSLYVKVFLSAPFVFTLNEADFNMLLLLYTIFILLWILYRKPMYCAVICIYNKTSFGIAFIYLTPKYCFHLYYKILHTVLLVATYKFNVFIFIQLNNISIDFHWDSLYSVQFYSHKSILALNNSRSFRCHRYQMLTNQEFLCILKIFIFGSE